MKTGRRDLQHRRDAAALAWAQHVERPAATTLATADPARHRVRPEILTSWELSRREVASDVVAAPLADEHDIASTWRDSPLQRGVAAIEDELRRTAEDGDLIIALTDARTRILWTYGGRVMRRKAESVNFMVGGCWDEASVGTNALAIAMREGRTSMVFSAEHYAPIVHNWVCWAAPVRDPATGRQIGVLDLSTTWDRTHPIGMATARMMARLIETAMPRSSWYDAAADQHPGPDSGLAMTLLGSAQTYLDGRQLLLNRRQSEILALLAMHPEGLSLDQLHVAVYGDQPVTLSTLKSEVSHLRSALGGRLASRPYRLLLPVTTDVDEVLTLLRAGEVSRAVAAYGGDLLPGTNSPALSELADYVAVALREALLADPRPAAVLAYSERAPYDTEVVEVALATLGDRPDPAKPLLRARIAAVRSEASNHRPTCPP